MRGIHRGPVNSPLKWPVTRQMFPFDDVIMLRSQGNFSELNYAGLSLNLYYYFKHTYFRPLCPRKMKFIWRYIQIHLCICRQYPNHWNVARFSYNSISQSNHVSKVLIASVQYSYSGFQKYVTVRFITTITIAQLRFYVHFPRGLSKLIYGTEVTLKKTCLLSTEPLCPARDGWWR